MVIINTLEEYIGYSNAVEKLKSEGETATNEVLEALSKYRMEHMDEINAYEKGLTEKVEEKSLGVAQVMDIDFDNLPDPRKNFEKVQQPASKAININEIEEKKEEIIIPDELKNVPVYEEEKDEDYDEGYSPSAGISGDSDFHDGGDEYKAEHPTVKAEELPIELGDVEQNDAQKEVIEQISKELNAKVEVVEKPKPQEIKMEITDGKENVYQEDIESLEKSAKNVSDDVDIIDTSEIISSMQESIDETKEELEQELVSESNKEEEKTYEVKLITDPNDEDLTPEESKTIKNMLEKKKQYLDKVVIGEQYSFFQSYKNKYMAPLTQMKIDKDTVVPSSGKYENDGLNDDAKIAALMKSLDRTTVKGNKTKIALPISGINVIMRAFTSGDVISMVEKIKSKYMRLDLQNEEMNSQYETSLAYLEMRKIQLETMWRHIEYITDAEGNKRQVTEQELYDLVKLPDLAQLFFAAFDATYRDKNKYSLQCPNYVKNANGNLGFCGHEFDYYAKNTEICYMPNTYITKEEMAMLRDGFPEGKKTVLKITEVGNTPVKLITSNKFILYFAIPTLKQYLETMDLILNLQQKEEYGLTQINLENADKELYGKPTISSLLLQACIYLNKMQKPVINAKKSLNKEEVEKVNVSFEDVTNKEDLIMFLTMLSPDELKNVLRDRGLKALMKFRGMRHYIFGAVCPKCGGQIDPVPINIEEIFFSTTMASTDI